MSDRKKPRSLSEIVNDVLRAVRDYYDSEYVYYIEKEYGDIETIFEVLWQKNVIMNALVALHRAIAAKK